eukprot:122934-Amorphochlora_amoeboformis.AAC.2
MSGGFIGRDEIGVDSDSTRQPNLKPSGNFDLGSESVGAEGRMASSRRGGGLRHCAGATLPTSSCLGQRDH